jgi:hypothetical protein
MRTPTTFPLHVVKLGTIGSIIASIYLLGALHGLQIGAAAQSLGVLQMPPVDMRLPFPIAGDRTYFPTATVLRYTSTLSMGAIITGLAGLLGAVAMYIAPSSDSSDD